MNTKQTHKIRTATLSTFVAILACVSTTSPAFARETHGAGEGGAGTSSVAPYTSR